MAAWYEDSNGRILEVPKPISLRTVIRNAILNALAYTDGHQQQAASWLGISARVLCYHLKHRGIPSADTHLRRRTRRQSRGALRMVARGRRMA